MTYNYYEAMKDDIQEYIKENYTNEELKEKLANLDDFKEELNDTLWITDSVTGNASGSYTFSTYKAEEYIAHNLDILKDAIMEFGGSFIDALERGAEYCDVTIRCYLLSAIISEVLDEMEV